MSEEHPNVATLRAIYADLTAISAYVTEDVVLHAAERAIPGAVPVYTGAQAVLDKEVDLIRRTAGTLVMDVDFVVANDYFGTAAGLLRASLGDEAITMPFCGLWRFHHGRIVEHWENAYAADEFAKFLARNPV
ncbi:SnoaL-like domain protein [Mycobacterium basiliense]|uniref:SnoaL-like domain protein n=2 Tax=Mycobacterium basiliense TaxID=2094119 RepID=A0A3S4CF59_9MYCO|nr:nuclear transport factor 2 family protein [Mycobacterium basiliense]VDM90876.1 SnoaL-like domain protein [Mycobacterium basiliense]